MAIGQRAPAPVEDKDTGERRGRKPTGRGFADHAVDHLGAQIHQQVDALLPRDIAGKHLLGPFDDFLAHLEALTEQCVDDDKKVKKLFDVIRDACVVKERRRGEHPILLLFRRGAPLAIPIFDLVHQLSAYSPGICFWRISFVPFNVKLNFSL